MAKKKTGSEKPLSKVQQETEAAFRRAGATGMLRLYRELRHFKRAKIDVSISSAMIGARGTRRNAYQVYAQPTFSVRELERVAKGLGKHKKRTFPAYDEMCGVLARLAKFLREDDEK